MIRTISRRTIIGKTVAELMEAISTSVDAVFHSSSGATIFPDEKRAYNMTAVDFVFMHNPTDEFHPSTESVSVNDCGFLSVEVMDPEG